MASGERSQEAAVNSFRRFLIPRTTWRNNAAHVRLLSRFENYLKDYQFRLDGLGIIMRIIFQEHLRLSSVPQNDMIVEPFCLDDFVSVLRENG